MTYQDLPHLIRDRIATYGLKTALRYKSKHTQNWTSISYSEAGRIIDALAKSVIDEGVAEQEMVGIFSRNMPEWTYCDFALMSARTVVVPIYATDSSAQAAYIISETSMRLIFVGEQEQYDKVLQAISGSGIDLSIVVFDEDVDLKNYGKAVYYKHFLARGLVSNSNHALQERLSRIDGDDLATVLYTSGTTGEPKGVMLKYKNFSNMLRIHDIYLTNVSENDTSLAFLPLSHIFERAWTIFSFHRGIQNHYLVNPRDVVEAMKEVKPTIMCTVPRFFEKTYQVAHEKLEHYSPLKKKIFYWAIGIGKKIMECRRTKQPVPFTDRLKYLLADNLVLKKGRHAFGGRIRLMPCAGAMLPDHINIFFHSVGIHIIYAYGLTETLATVAAFPHTRFKFGTVGLPLPEVEMKIGDEDEILLKGGSIFSGYYKKPEETKLAFTDGWFRTGDAGAIDSDGYLVMKERIKDLIKTSSGKFVAPQQVESLLCSDPYIEQAIAIGDNRKFLTALLVPSFPLLEDYARQQKIVYPSREELVKHPSVIEFMEEKLRGIQADLANYQKVKRFVLLPGEFTIAGGEFTSTLKLKRKFIAQKYHDLIEEIYKE